MPGDGPLEPARPSAHRSAATRQRASAASAVAEPYLLAVLDAEPRRASSVMPTDAARPSGSRARRSRGTAACAGASRPRASPTAARHRRARPCAPRPRAASRTSVMSSVLRDEVRAAVERIDLLGVVEADPPQHLLDRACVSGADLADDRAHVVGQQLGVDRIVGEQRVDELLVVLREQIGLLVREAGELAAERLPQLRRAVGLERRQQLATAPGRGTARGACG